MVIKSHTLLKMEARYVYRPPYMMYGDDDVEGKAVSKDEVSK